MRLFLAIDIPSTIKKKIFQLTESLRNQYPNYSWVSQENYHITLHFFGEVNENKIEKIKQRIEDVVWDIKPFYLYSRSAGVFSNRKHIIYLDFYREKEIERLAKKIKSVFKERCQEHSSYLPHLTLARGKRSSKQQYYALLKKIRQLKIKINFYVNQIILYQSIITQEKPVYKSLYQFKLKK